MDKLIEHLLKIKKQQDEDRQARSDFRQDWESKVKHGLEQIKDWLRPVSIYSDVFAIDRKLNETEFNFRGVCERLSLEGLVVRIDERSISFVPAYVRSTGNDSTAARIEIRGTRCTMDLNYCVGGWTLFTNGETLPWNAEALENLLLQSTSRLIL
jgi:hypothetical protein